MSFYVGAERFEPTQRDAQWRNRCTAEVQSYADYHTGSGKNSSRGRNPILGIEPLPEDQFVVVPNPEKIGARNAPEVVLLPPTGHLEPVKQQATTTNLAEFFRDPCPAVSETGSRKGYACLRGVGGRRPGTGRSNTTSTLSVKSGLSSSVVSSSAPKGSNDDKNEPQGPHRLRVRIDPTPSMSGKSNSSAGISKLEQVSGTASLASTRSTILIEALGEETRRRVEAEKEVMRLAMLLEQQRAG